MPRPVTQAEFARKAGVSRMAISKATKGGQLAAAILPGGRIDLEHQSARAYLRAKGVESDRAPTRTRSAGGAPAAAPTKVRQPRGGSRKKVPPRRRRSDEEAEIERDESPRSDPPEAAVTAGPSTVTAEDIEVYAHLSLTELCELFGTATAFKDWLASLKLIEEVREKNLKNDETEGRLIERELVATHVFGAIESFHRRLLGDSAKTIARRVYSLSRTGTAVEEAERVVREVISSQLNPVRDKAARVLRSTTNPPSPRNG